MKKIFFSATRILLLEYTHTQIHDSITKIYTNEELIMDDKYLIWINSFIKRHLDNRCYYNFNFMYEQI
jgi:hypothetical protein